MGFTDFFKTEFLPFLNKEVKVTFRSDSTDSNNLGELDGVDLDSPNYSGYIYYWGKGYLDFSLYNIEEDREEIETMVIETDDFLSQLAEIRAIADYFRTT